MKDILKKIKQYFLTSKERRHALVGLPKLWQQKKEYQIKFLLKMGLKPEHLLADIGCGTLRGGIPIINYLNVGHYTGIESRDFVLDEAKKELKEEKLEHKKPTLILSGDFYNLTSERQFDYMWAFSVLFHMEDHIMEGVIKYVSRHLKPDGVFYANVNYGIQKDHNWQGFPVMFRSFKFYKDVADKYLLNVEDIGNLKEHGHISGVEDQDIQKMLRFTKRLK